MQNLVLKSDVLQWVFCYVLQPSRIEFSKLSSCEVRRLNKLRASRRKLFQALRWFAFFFLHCFLSRRKAFVCRSRRANRILILFSELIPAQLSLASQLIQPGLII